MTKVPKFGHKLELLPIICTCSHNYLFIVRYLSILLFSALCSCRYKI